MRFVWTGHSEPSIRMAGDWTASEREQEREREELVSLGAVHLEIVEPDRVSWF